MPDTENSSYERRKKQEETRTDLDDSPRQLEQEEEEETQKKIDMRKIVRRRGTKFRFEKESGRRKKTLKGTTMDK